MRIFADRLSEQLNKQLSRVYLIFGNEPLLLQESRESIQKAAKEQGFGERHRFAILKHIAALVVPPTRWDGVDRDSGLIERFGQDTSRHRNVRAATGTRTTPKYTVTCR